MGLPVAESYWLVRFVLQRGLAVVYLAAFLVAAHQFRPLAGEDGLSPLGDRLRATAFRDRPSLFRLVPDDRVIAATAWFGVALSALALFAGPYWLPDGLATPAAMALWAALWLLYLNFVNAGGIFYGYGWESMLLETGFLAVFLGAGSAGPPVVVVWLFKWVLFRNMFGAGLIKLRGDACWRDLTCLDYHYQTQPMPNPLSWYVHHLPDRFHRVETLGNHVVELAVPFLYFAPQPYAAVGGALTIGFHLWLIATGNFSWLNAITVVQAVATFTDRIIATVLPVAAPAAAPTPTYLQAASVAVAALVLVLSVRPVRNVLSERQRMNAGWDPLHLVNSYGAFGSITRDRYEIVVEATTDPAPTDADWHAYEFPGKPTDTTARPPQIAPYHHRLGWQLWFAAMRPTPRRSPWFHRLLEKLLAGDDATQSLLAHDPFDGDAPEYVRAVRYRYRFTTPAERAETGNWWARERVGSYVRPVAADD